MPYRPTIDDDARLGTSLPTPPCSYLVLPLSHHDAPPSLPIINNSQPFQIQTPEGNINWALNSEIYNHDDIRANQLAGVEHPSKSDSS